MPALRRRRFSRRIRNWRAPRIAASCAFWWNATRRRSKCSGLVRRRLLRRLGEPFLDPIQLFLRFGELVTQPLDLIVLRFAVGGGCLRLGFRVGDLRVRGGGGVHGNLALRYVRRRHAVQRIDAGGGAEQGVGLHPVLGGLAGADIILKQRYRVAPPVVVPGAQVEQGAPVGRFARLLRRRIRRRVHGEQRVGRTRSAIGGQRLSTRERAVPLAVRGLEQERRRADGDAPREKDRRDREPGE